MPKGDKIRRIDTRVIIDPQTQQVIDMYGLTSTYIYKLMKKYDIEYPDGYYLKMSPREKIERTIDIWYTKLIEKRRKLLKGTRYEGFY